MTGVTSVFVVDGDVGLCEVLLAQLRGRGVRARAFAGPDAFFAALPSEAVACVVADVSAPAVDGPDLLRRLAQQKGQAWGVVGLSTHASVSLVVEMMKLGAADFIEKPCEPERITEAALACVSRLERGEGLRAMRDRARRLHQTLSEREHQVFDGLVQGQANKAIARDLAISDRTVEVFRARVMRKMQADSIAALIRSAVLLDE